MEQEYNGKMFPNHCGLVGDSNNMNFIFSCLDAIHHAWWTRGHQGFFFNFLK